MCEHTPPVHVRAHSTSERASTLHQCICEHTPPVHMRAHSTSECASTLHQCMCEHTPPVNVRAHSTSEHTPPVPQGTMMCVVLKGGPELCLSDLSLNPAMLACYPGDGARFEQHLDNNPAAPDCRLVTVEGLRTPRHTEWLLLVHRQFSI